MSSMLQSFYIGAASHKDCKSKVHPTIIRKQIKNMGNKSSKKMHIMLLQAENTKCTNYKSLSFVFLTSFVS